MESRKISTASRQPEDQQVNVQYQGGDNYQMTVTRAQDGNDQYGINGAVTHYQGPTTVTETHYQGPTTVTEYQGATSQMGETRNISSYQQASYQGNYQQGSYQQGGVQTQHMSSGGYITSQPMYTTQQMSTGHSISGQHVISGTQMGETTTTSYVGGSRFVTGEERVIGYNTIQQEERILSERIVEHEIKVPKRIIREEVIEKVIIVPETITREEVIEEIQRVKETIIEVAKPVKHEKIIEVPEIEYRDKIVEKIERIVQEKIREVAKIEYQERIVEIPKIVTQEKVVEVPEIEYREVIVEKFVEVPEIREQVMVREVPVPQYVDKPVAQYVDVEQPFDVERNIPVPVEAITTFEYQLARFRPRVNKVQYPLYVPRFVEVPVSAELFDHNMIASLQAQASKLSALSSTQAVGLCEIENMATEFRRTDVSSLQASNMDLQSALINAWKSGRITMRGQETTHVQHHMTYEAPVVTQHMTYEAPVVTQHMTYEAPVTHTSKVVSAPEPIYYTNTPAYPASTHSRKHKKSSPSRSSRR